MKGLQIKIGGQWIYLPDDFSIDLEQTSPVFNDQGTFSFPFEIPLAPNREVFKNVDDPFGDRPLREIDKSDTEIWFNGVMIYRGTIATDDEIEFEDSLPVTFSSGTGNFMDKLEGMKANEIPLDRELKLGYELYRADTAPEIQGSVYPMYVYLPYRNLMNFTEFNVSDPYPIKTFCNVRVCASDENGKYAPALEAKRSYSGVCFYVMYLIDLVMKKLDIGVDKNEMLDVEDLCRLAFFSTRCEVKSGESRTIQYADVISESFIGPSFSLEVKVTGGKGIVPIMGTFRNSDFTYSVRDVYATNANFPDLEVKDVIEDLQNAFGVRFVYDERDRLMRIYLLRNIFQNRETNTLDVDILSCAVTKEKNKGYRITYGQDDDTTFNYTDYTNVSEKDGYLEILKMGQSAYDTTCYIDRITGNAYRIKVNKDTGSDPSLFEVGGFRDYETEGADPEEAEEIKLSFSPVIVNDISGASTSQMASEGKEAQQGLAVFADVSLLSDTRTTVSVLPLMGNFLFLQNIKDVTADVTFDTGENFDREETTESPLATYDAGYTLGIMRGPGNDSGVEIINTNYDGENNDSWIQTVGSYAFTSDSCDNFGRFFDYNGTEAGGADQTNRFSLKPVAEKDGYPIGEKYKGRGFVAKFLSEYLYFMSNKKTVTLQVRMDIMQIVNIDFFRRYRIGRFTGFINRISYTLGVTGVADVKIELYTL